MTPNEDPDDRDGSTAGESAPDDGTPASEPTPDDGTRAGEAPPADGPGAGLASPPDGTQGAPPPPERPPGGGGQPGTGRSLAEYVQWGLLAILLLLTAIATLRFYFAASTAVDRFVTRQFRPLFQAAFNLAILLAAGVGLSILVRRLS